MHPPRGVQSEMADLLLCQRLSLLSVIIALIGSSPAFPSLSQHRVADTTRGPAREPSSLGKSDFQLRDHQQGSSPGCRGRCARYSLLRPSCFDPAFLTAVDFPPLQILAPPAVWTEKPGAAPAPGAVPGRTADGGCTELIGAARLSSVDSSLDLTARSSRIPPAFALASRETAEETGQWSPKPDNLLQNLLKFGK